MGSGSNVNVPEEDQGIIPRVVNYMFDQAMLKSQDDNYAVEFKIMFLEIYGEEIRDLLEPLIEGSTASSKV